MAALYLIRRLPWTDRLTATTLAVLGPRSSRHRKPYDLPFTLDTVASLRPGLTVSVASGLGQSSNLGRKPRHAVRGDEPGYFSHARGNGRKFPCEQRRKFSIQFCPIEFGEQRFSTTATNAAGNTGASADDHSASRFSRRAGSRCRSGTRRCSKPFARTPATPRFATRGAGYGSGGGLRRRQDAIQGQPGYYVTLAAPRRRVARGSDFRSRA